MLLLAASQASDQGEGRFAGNQVPRVEPDPAGERLGHVHPLHRREPAWHRCATLRPTRREQVRDQRDVIATITTDSTKEVAAPELMA
jgi:hypothetical protein